MRILAITESIDHVCGRYRVRAFAPAIVASGSTLEIQGLQPGLIPRLRQIHQTSDYDVVLLQRKLLPAWQTALLRRRAKRLIFDFDDAVLYRDSNDPRGPYCRRRAQRFRAMMSVCDSVIAGNYFLAGRAIQNGASEQRVRVIPTCVDTSRYQPLTHKPRTSGLELTWIGSSSTLKGLESQGEIWERIGKEVTGSRIRLICDRFPTFQNLPVVPVVWNESTEADELAQADVGVSWIPEGLWSEGKCGLKILQYQAAGLPVVANPVGVHSEMIVSGLTGFLPITSNEWVESIRTIATDERLRNSMAVEARRSVERKYSVAAWESTFVATIVGLTAPKAPHLQEVIRPMIRQNQSWE
jgi:glycosyltransferase involved in cell wall biosynthesis